MLVKIKRIGVLLVSVNALFCVFVCPVFALLGVISYFRPIRGMWLFGDEVIGDAQRFLWIFLSLVFFGLGLVFNRWKRTTQKATHAEGHGVSSIR